MLSDRETFEGIIARHGGMLWRTTAVYEADHHLREDLYQEILLAVWRALPRLRDEGNLRTYLARIAHNRSVSHVQGRMRLPKGADSDPDVLAGAAAGPDRQAEIADGRVRLLAAVARLPVDWRQVVTLTLEDFAPREIAEVLGLSTNVVSVRLTRAKAVLRESMEDNGHDR